MQEKYTITIARQFGSLGRPIAEKMKLPVSVIRDEEESAKTKYFAMKFPMGTGTTIIQEEIFRAQKKVIRELAEKESCIIVGRCADYILRDRKNCLNIFIYAPYEARIKNCTDILHMDYEDAKKTIEDVDKARDAYHKAFAGYLPQDINHSNLLVDSSVLGVAGTADLLVYYVKKVFLQE